MASTLTDVGNLLQEQDAHLDDIKNKLNNICSCFGLKNFTYVTNGDEIKFAVQRIVCFLG